MKDLFSCHTKIIPLLLSQLCIMDLPNPTGGRRFNSGDNITVNYIQSSTQEVLEIVRANSILAGKKISHELVFLTLSHVEQYCCVRRSYQQHPIFFYVRQGFSKLISTASEGKWSTKFHSIPMNSHTLCISVEDKNRDWLSKLVDAWHKRRKSLTYNLDYFS